MAITATGSFNDILTHPWATFDDPNPGDWKLTYFDGSIGRGTLNVAGGNLFDGNGWPVSVGWGTGTSTITVTGPDSELRNSGTFVVGNNGSHGDLIVEDGGCIDISNQIFIGKTGLGTGLVTGNNSKLITDNTLQFGQQTGGAGSILTVEDSGLVAANSVQFGFDPSSGYLHMGVAGVLAVQGSHLVNPFVTGGLFTIIGAGSVGEIQHHNGATWVNMTGAIEGTDYTLDYKTSPYIINGQDLDGYTVLTMTGPDAKNRLTIGPNNRLTIPSNKRLVIDG
jgi:T5SS/PEP-CTERM-associated repeat protein